MVLFMGQDIYHPDVDPVEVRRRVGMVFQKPNPFPKSIYENVAWGARLNGFKPSLGRPDMDEWVEKCLRKAALWDEVKDLSLGQQQRLCMARLFAVHPDVILMDEPASALDPIATGRIEELIDILKSQYTIVIVTHNMQQAGRISDYTGLFWLGELIEYSSTNQMFTRPQKEITEDYITGRMGYTQFWR